MAEDHVSQPQLDVVEARLEASIAESLLHEREKAEHRIDHAICQVAEVFDTKLSAVERVLTWRMTAALLGGQVVAASVATLVSGKASVHDAVRLLDTLLP